MQSLGSLTPAQFRSRLSGSGIVLDLGAMKARVRSPLAALAPPMQTVYRHYPLIDDTVFVDVQVDLERSPGLRGLLRPSLRFIADGLDPFGAQPLDSTLPQLEWGLNWCFATMLNRYLMLHSGVVEIGGRGLLMIGEPGSGKSTLTAALMMSGARALSDEFGVVDLTDGRLLPLAKPIALKNRSIDVIRQRSSDAVFGPTYHNTHKGDVAHLAMTAMSAEARHDPAVARIVVFPRWQEGADLSLRPVGPAEAFGILAFNSFNFDTLGPDAFDAVRKLVGQCRFFRLRYGRVDEAVKALFELCGEPDRASEDGTTGASGTTPSVPVAP